MIDKFGSFILNHAFGNMMQRVMKGWEPDSKLWIWNWRNLNQCFTQFYIFNVRKLGFPTKFQLLWEFAGKFKVVCNFSSERRCCFGNDGIFFSLSYYANGLYLESFVLQIPVRPFRHDEYERFLTAAFPYYGASFSMVPLSLSDTLIVVWAFKLPDVGRKSEGGGCDQLTN